MEININFLLKVKIEFIVKDLEVDRIVNIIVKVVCFGKIGDGKIFIYNVENVVRIRIGE